MAAQRQEPSNVHLDEYMIKDAFDPGPDQQQIERMLGSLARAMPSQPRLAAVLESAQGARDVTSWRKMSPRGILAIIDNDSHLRALRQYDDRNFRDPQVKLLRTFLYSICWTHS